MTKEDTVVDRLEGSIRMLVKPKEEIFKNKIMRIDTKYAKNQRMIKIKLTPYI
jgi:hypothetical protein